MSEPKALSARDAAFDKLQYELAEVFSRPVDAGHALEAFIRAILAESLPAKAEPAGAGAPEALPQHTCCTNAGGSILTEPLPPCPACKRLYERGEHWTQQPGASEGTLRLPLPGPVAEGLRAAVRDAGINPDNRPALARAIVGIEQPKPDAEQSAGVKAGDEHDRSGAGAAPTPEAQRFEIGQHVEASHRVVGVVKWCGAGPGSTVGIEDEDGEEWDFEVAQVRALASPPVQPEEKR